jgi:hypothetical protein
MIDPRARMRTGRAEMAPLAGRATSADGALASSADQGQGSRPFTALDSGRASGRAVMLDVALIQVVDQVTTAKSMYAARLDIDYPASLDRVSTAFRIIWIIPIAIVLSALSATAASSVTVINESGQVVSFVSRTGGGIVGGLFVATVLMVVFRQRYPRWWFDFALQLHRFMARVGAYAALLTDRYPSTVEEQSVHLDLDYPDSRRDLNRWLPLVKWLLVMPHLIVLAVLGIGAAVAVVIAWFAILFTGRYPRPLFDFVVGVGRWALRVTAYATLLVTDRYPPFRLS